MNQMILALGTALGRPATWSGYAREAVSLVADAAVFPLGLLAPDRMTPLPAWTRARQAPVVLVHGYGHNHSAWLHLSRGLRRAGITEIATQDYNPLKADIPACGAALRTLVDRVRARTGASKVDVVGHSMGGLVSRWMVQECDGWDAVRTVVTIASPHEGTHVARFGPGRTARQMVPGSWLVRRLADGMRSSDVRWVALYSNIDALILPSASAKISHPDARAENVLVKDLGHLGILLSSRATNEVVRRLLTVPGSSGCTEHHPPTLSAPRTSGPQAA